MMSLRMEFISLLLLNILWVQLYLTTIFICGWNTAINNSWSYLIPHPYAERVRGWERQQRDKDQERDVESMILHTSHSIVLLKVSFAQSFITKWITVIRMKLLFRSDYHVQPWNKSYEKQSGNKLIGQAGNDHPYNWMLSPI